MRKPLYILACLNIQDMHCNCKICISARKHAFILRVRDNVEDNLKKFDKEYWNKIVEKKRRRVSYLRTKNKKVNIALEK